MIQLVRAKEEHIAELVRISKEAFDSDTSVGADKAGGPPDYDDANWHMAMMNEEHLFTALHNERIVGGAILFRDKEKRSFMYIGRIFVAPADFKKGFGISLMKQIEEMYPDVSTWMLDTPIWNIRTNRFYKKLGYHEVKRDKALIYYQKNR